MKRSLSWRRGLLILPVVLVLCLVIYQAFNLLRSEVSGYGFTVFSQNRGRGFDDLNRLFTQAHKTPFRKFIKDAFEMHLTKVHSICIF